VQPVKLLTCMWKVSVTDVVRDTNSDYTFCGSSVNPSKCLNSSYSQATTSSVHIFSNSFPYQPTVRRSIASDTDSDVG
jgi:hypothetical protein